MRITGVRLQNIACFEDLSLDFTNEDTGEAAPWVVILGENGCGKSTLLQMMSANLLSLRNVSAVAPAINWSGYWRYPLSTIAHPRHSMKFVDGATDIRNFDSKPDYRDPHSIEGNFDWPEVNQVDQEATAPRGFSCGYGASRRIGSQPASVRGSLPTIDESAKPFRFASMFGTSMGMTNVTDWIVGLYFSAIFPNHSVADKNRYEKARDAILSALPHISSLEITKERRVMVTEGDTVVPLERLSDGYRGTLAWIGDLIRRLFDAYPDSEDPLKESGVVLVDEIDLHLHPKWQRSVVEDVRKLFPNLQFIVTSHSPFVAQDMRPEDKIIVFERSGKDGKGPVVAREESGTLHDWSADQILSSYFGLRDGTRGEQTQKAEARFVRLLEAEVKGTLTAKQAKELAALRERMDRIPVGETASEQAFYKAADDVLTKLRLRRDALQADQTNNGNGNGDHSD